MAREKHPVGRVAPPAYPSRAEAAIRRRRFLALVGGGAAAALLGPACGDESCARSDPTVRLGGAPPDPRPDPQEVAAPADAGSRAAPATTPDASVPDAAASSPAPRAAGERRPRRPKQKKKPHDRGLAGAPLPPDFEL